jgi:sarcosine oxidase/sarcosine oxidase subunit beta
MEFDWYGPVSDSLARMAIPFRDVPMDEVVRDLPMVNRDGLLRVVETCGAGMLLADRIVAGLAAHLAAQGVDLRPNTRITHVDPEHGRLDDWQGDAVVVGPLAENPRPSRQTIAYLAPPAAMAEAWARAPVLLNRLPGPAGGAYVLPPRAGTHLKIGDYSHTFAGDPDGDRATDPARLDALMAAGAAAIADFDRYRLIEARSCYYAVTDDERFAVRPLGARGWLASPCSGHGFKLAALIGETLADGVVGTRPAAEVTAYLAGRLTEPA